MKILWVKCRWNESSEMKGSRPNPDQTIIRRKLERDAPQGVPVLQLALHRNLLLLHDLAESHLGGVIPLVTAGCDERIELSGFVVVYPVNFLPLELEGENRRL